MTDLRKIIHIDMDAFFASVEQLDEPKFRGKPLIVGGKPESRGVVAACSYEARSFGIRSAMPCSKAYKLCPQAIFTPPRMARYREVSHIIMDIFCYFTDIIEPLSVDEAFLDVTTNKLQQPSATRLAEIIRQKIHSETGLTASAGVSYNKFLAKIASDLDKPNGLSVILPDDAYEFLGELPIGKFYGVGKVTEQKMRNIGIKNGKDLRQFSKEDLLFHFGKTGAFYYDMVRGKDNRPVSLSRIRKSIGSETTFHNDILDTKEIDRVLNLLAEKISGSLEKRHYVCQTVTLKVRYHDFKTITRSTTSNHSLWTTKHILERVSQLKQSTEIGNKKIRLLGISVSKLNDKSTRKPYQLKLPFV